MFLPNLPLFQSSTLLLTLIFLLGTARADTVTWTGGSSADWATGANWTNSAGSPGAPTVTDDVMIDGGARQPLLNLAAGAVTITSLSLGSTSNSTLTFTNGSVSTKRLIVTGDVTIYTNGTITHAAETATGSNPENHRLFLNVGGNLTIAAGGKIDVSGMGYNTSQGPGAGGGYGGQGGGSTITYGSVTNPVNSGSGGITYGGHAGRGAGAVVLAIGGDLTLNGSVLADGGATDYGSGGSGGSINIVASRLFGAGTISAKGGNVGFNAASGDGGGGGRIAVVLTNADTTAFANLTAIRAHGGFRLTNNDRYAAAGTIYLKGTNQTYGTLIVNNNGQSTTYTTLYQAQTNQFDTIITTNGARFALGNNAQLTMTGTVWNCDTSSRIILAAGANAQIIAPAFTIPMNATLSCAGTNWFSMTSDIVVTNGGRLTHEVNGTTPANRLSLIVNGSLTVAAGGIVGGTGLGYAGGQGSGGPGDPGVNYSYGCGHGGVGGGPAGGTTYGSVTNPLTLGSSTAGGNGGPIPGGGVVLLAVRAALVVNGTIRADGSTAGSSPALGGGSGGTVNIVAASLSGTGTVSAAGGSTLASGCSGGGGGRVAIVLTNASDTAFTSLAAIHAYGGAPAGAGEYGAAGTVYLKGTNQAYGRLTVNNNSQTSTRRTLLNSAVTDKTAGDVVLRNLGTMGLGAGETLTVYGSWSNAVATNAFSGGTVVLAGPGPATVWGGNTWSNLVITNVGKVVSFEAGKTQTVYGVPVFSNVTLQSSAAGSWWYLRKPGSGTQEVDRVTVQDSNATNGWLFRADVRSTDLGHNVNWRFVQPAGTVFILR